MSNGFREIRDTSPLSMKLLNDQMRYLWTKIMGNIDDRDIKLESIKEKNLSSEIKQELGKISLAVTKDNVINSINISTEGIAIDGDKININANNLDLSANDSVRIAVGQIGGVNLLPNSKHIMTYPNGPGQGNTIFYNDIENPHYQIVADGNFISVYEGDIYAYMSANCIAGRKYTISVEVYPYVFSDVGFYGGIGMNKGLAPFQYHRISYTFTYSPGLRVGGLQTYNYHTITYRRWKLEEGENVTTWTSAREDTVNEIFVDTNGIVLQGNKIQILGPTHIPNLLFDKMVGGTAKLGGSGNGNGVLEVYNALDVLMTRLNNAGLYAIAGQIADFVINSSGLSGGTITGATLQTASSGGIRMNSSVGFRVHDNMARKRFDILPNQVHPTLAFYDTAGGYDFTMSYRPAAEGQRAGFWLSATSLQDLILFGKDVYAKSLLISSDREQKTNIEEVKVEDIEETIKNIKTYEYNLKAEIKEETMGIMTMMSFDSKEPKKVLGVMADELPPNVLNQEENAVNLYSFSTMLLQGQQDQYAKINELQSKVDNQQSIIDDLIRRIELLESQAQ